MKDFTRTSLELSVIYLFLTGNDFFCNLQKLIAHFGGQKEPIFTKFDGMYMQIFVNFEEFSSMIDTYSEP